MAKNDDPQARRFLMSMESHGEGGAGARFCEAHPLGRSAGPEKRIAWAKDLCAFLSGSYDEETVRAIRMDCACGPQFGRAKLRALYLKEKDPYAFAESVNRLDLGFSLEYDGTAYDLVYPECYCACVKRSEELLPRAWCWCTLGYNKRLFEAVFGSAVRVELLSAVKHGDPVCRIRITPQEA